MTPGERRNEISPQSDPERFAFLQALPAEERSEAGAKYDHARELQRMDPADDYWQTRAKTAIRTSRRELAIIENAATIPYDAADLLDRMRRGRITSPGQDRAVARVLQDVDCTVTQEEIDRVAAEMVTQRREYIAQRYGVASAAALLGARGGAATKGISTPAKRRAARRNAQLGGRPRKPQTPNS